MYCDFIEKYHRNDFISFFHTFSRFSELTSLKICTMVVNFSIDPFGVLPQGVPQETPPKITLKISQSSSRNSFRAISRNTSRYSSQDPTDSPTYITSKIFWKLKKKCFLEIPRGMSRNSLKESLKNIFSIFFV